MCLLQAHAMTAIVSLRRPAADLCRRPAAAGTRIRTTGARARSTTTRRTASYCTPSPRTRSASGQKLEARAASRAELSARARARVRARARESARGAPAPTRLRSPCAAPPAGVRGSRLGDAVFTAINHRRGRRGAVYRAGAAPLPSWEDRPSLCCARVGTSECPSARSLPPASVYAPLCRATPLADATNSHAKRPFTVQWLNFAVVVEATSRHRAMHTQFCTTE